MSRQLMSISMRFSASGTFCFSQKTFGTTPNIAPPSILNVPSLKMSIWKRPKRMVGVWRTTRGPAPRDTVVRMDIRTYRDGDGDRLRTFWLTCGIKIRPGDDDEALARFAARNPGLMLLAEEDAHLVGSALGGWDGRRGWLYHGAVHRADRPRGIGRSVRARA